MCLGAVRHYRKWPLQQFMQQWAHVHDAVLAGRGDRSLKLPHITQQKNSVPKLLQEEIITAALSASAGSANGVVRNVVIDLFAGYGSLRTVVKEHGLHYVAVDIKDFMK